MLQETFCLNCLHFNLKALLQELAKLVQTPTESFLPISVSKLICPLRFPCQHCPLKNNQAAKGEKMERKRLKLWLSDKFKPLCENSNPGTFLQSHKTLLMCTYALLTLPAAYTVWCDFHDAYLNGEKNFITIDKGIHASPCHVDAYIRI